MIAINVSKGTTAIAIVIATTKINKRHNNIGNVIGANSITVR